MKIITAGKCVSGCCPGSMISTQNDVFAHQFDMAPQQFETLRQRFSRFGLAVSESHNAAYGPVDVLRVLGFMSGRRMFAESAVTHLRRHRHDGGAASEAGACNRRTPSPDRIPRTIRCVSPDGAQKWCSSTVQHTVRGTRRSGMAR